MNEIAFLPKRLTLPEPATEEKVRQWRHDLAKFLQDVALNAKRTTYDVGQVANGLVMLVANANDGDTVTVTIGTIVKVYEFDSNAAITEGRVSVTIGGSAAASAANLAAAITTAQGLLVTAVQHATDTSVVDLAAIAAGGVFTLAESTAGVRIAVQDSANEQVRGLRYQFISRRIVTDVDVTRGRVLIQTTLVTLLWWQVLVQTSATIPTTTAYDGGVTITDGTIELDASGGSDLVAGNVILVHAEGTR